MPFLRPPALVQGDRVAVVAPAGPFDRPSFEAGLALVAARFKPVFGEELFSQHRYLAGDDPRRARELDAALADPAIKAVFAARGGYGTMRLLPALRWDRYAPKPIVGFSDLVALHAAAQAHGWVSVHGPVLTQLGRQPPEVAERLFALLQGTAVAPLEGGRTLVAGVAEGPLVGGCLSVFTRLLGTPYLPSLDGAVLLVEDVGERPYRLDRMWTHLRLAGAFERLAGVVVGDLTDCDEKDGSVAAADVVAELAAATGLPCAAGFPIGHGARNLAVPLGARVRLDASRGRLELLGGAVA